MKFEIHYVLESKIGRIEAPNKENPVESVSLKAVLARLAEQMPDSFFNVRLVGVRVVEVAEFVPSDDAGEGFHVEACAAHQRHIDELQAIVNKLPHMDDIETAILAINCGSGDEFREDFCQCDHEVGVTMCMHCAVWDVLCKVKAARLAGEKQGDER